MQRIKGHINSSFTVYDGALADDPTHQLFLCVCVYQRGICLRPQWRTSWPLTRWSTVASGTVLLCAPWSTTPNGSEVSADTCACVCVDALSGRVRLCAVKHSYVGAARSASRLLLKLMWVWWLEFVSTLLSSTWIDAYAGRTGLSQHAGS